MPGNLIVLHLCIWFLKEDFCHFFGISKYLKLAGRINLLSVSASLCYSIMTSSHMGLLSSAVDNQETDREETESDQESVSWSHLL